MRIYLVTVECDLDGIGEWEDMEICVVRAPSALEADRTAYNHARMMGWNAGGTAGTTEAVETCPAGATSIRYTGIY